MLCLVADREELDPIGRRVARRLKAIAKSRKLSVGQVFYHMQNAMPEEELPSLKTVEAFLRGSQVKPTFDVVYAVARGLGLTLDQAMGVSPMPPESAPVRDEDEDDLASRFARFQEWTKSQLEQIRDGAAQKAEMDATNAERDQEARRAGEANEHKRDSTQRSREGDQPPGRRGKAK